MAKKYLDDTGLAHLWDKIKDYVSAHSGGSTVSVVRNQTTGNKIADLTIDGTTTSLYAGKEYWGDVSLNKTLSNTISVSYVPYLSSTTGTTAILSSAGITPVSGRIAKYNANKQLNSEDMSASDVTSFIDSLSGTPIAPADYVVETSSNSYWRWVKWNSGRVELWGWFSQANVSAYATNSFVIGSASVCPYPFTISEPRTIVSGQKINNGGCYVSYDYGRTDYWSGIANPTVGITIAQGTTATITWTCYVNARWK